MLPHDATNFPAIATRHHHVEQHERRLYCLEQCQCLIAIVCDRYRISANLEILTDNLGVIVIIVDHEDRRQVGVVHVLGDEGGARRASRAGILCEGQDASHFTDLL